MKNNLYKVMLFLFIIFISSMSITEVHAKTLNDMYKELNSLKEEKARVNNEKKLTQNEINSLNDTIVDIGVEIENAREEVEKANKEISESEETISKKHEESKELLKFLQLSTGENVYLDYVLASEDYTDFVYRYSVVTQLTNYNDELIKDLEDLVTSLEQKKTELAKKQEELAKKQKDMTGKKVLLNSQLSEITEGYVDINEEIEALNKSINYYKNLGCSPDQDITKCSAIPYADGFKYPLKSATISSGWGWRTLTLNGKTKQNYHYGYDFAGNPEGTSVYSIAPGKVARIINKSSCGGNQVYIYHTVNGKNYTSKYVHLLSIKVKLGDIVTENTVIGTIGGRSTATKYGGYDTCTTGAHLHFGIADGHHISYVDSYTFNPVKIFPKLTGKYSSFKSR